MKSTKLKVNKKLQEKAAAIVKGKDPKRVAAGRKGGKLSPTNFSRNREGAKAAGQRSAWARHSGKLSDYPPLLIRPDGGLTPLNDPEVPPRKNPPIRRKT